MGPGPQQQFRRIANPDFVLSVGAGLQPRAHRWIDRLSPRDFTNRIPPSIWQCCGCGKNATDPAINHFRVGRGLARCGTEISAHRRSAF